MAIRNGSGDPVSLYATNGIDTEANVKMAINDIVKVNPFLDDIDLAGVTDSTQLTYALAKKQSALLLLLSLAHQQSYSIRCIYTRGRIPTRP